MKIVVTNKCINRPLELDFVRSVLRLDPLETKEFTPLAHFEVYAQHPSVKALVEAGELSISYTSFQQPEPVEDPVPTMQEETQLVTEVSEEPTVEESAPAAPAKRTRQK